MTAVASPVFARPSQRETAAPKARHGWASWIGWMATVAVVVLYADAARRGTVSALGLIVTVLVLVGAGPVFVRVARRSPGIDLVGLLRLSLALRFIAVIPRFESRIDAWVYHRVGQDLAESFRRLDFTVDTGRSIPGTGAVRYATGLVEVLTFDDEFTTFLVFALFAFVGQIFFIRALQIALPRLHHRRYALLVLFWPSLLYWPSSIGKEALMLLGLGGASVGVAWMLKGRRRGLLWAVAFLAIAALVRPHVALIVVTAAVGALVVRSSGRTATRIAAVLTLVIVGSLAANGVESILDIDGLSGTSVSRALDIAESRSSQGGSGFEAARIDTPLDIPWGTITVLFRPFAWEATSAEMLVSALEGALLAVLSVMALPRIAAATRYLRSEAYIVYALAFSAIFVYLFSALGNFGILTRQRTMVIPFVLVLLALPTTRERVRQRRLA